MYLGAHFPSDVLAAIAEAAAWIAFVFAIVGVKFGETWRSASLRTLDSQQSDG
jgi:membrane-associated phospholipid phosphatase